MRGTRWGARWLWGALGLLAAAGPAAAQVAPGGTPPAKPSQGGDPEVVDFLLPGAFDAALAKARTLHRPLIIKGVAFGIDSAGASCATKGHW